MYSQPPLKVGWLHKPVHQEHGPVHGETLHTLIQRETADQQHNAISYGGCNTYHFRRVSTILSASLHRNAHIGGEQVVM